MQGQNTAWQGYHIQWTKHCMTGKSYAMDQTLDEDEIKLKKTQTLLVDEIKFKGPYTTWLGNQIKKKHTLLVGEIKFNKLYTVWRGNQIQGTVHCITTISNNMK